MGKTLIMLGILLVAIGALLHFGGKFFPLGNLPGDFKWQKGNVSFYFPVVTCLVLSIALSVLLNFFNRR